MEDTEEEAAVDAEALAEEVTADTEEVAVDAEEATAETVAADI